MIHNASNFAVDTFNRASYARKYGEFRIVKNITIRLFDIYLTIFGNAHKFPLLFLLLLILFLDMSIVYIKMIKAWEWQKGIACFLLSTFFFLSSFRYMIYWWIQSCDGFISNIYQFALVSSCHGGFISPSRAFHADTKLAKGRKNR